MKKRIQIPFKHVALSILLSVGAANISFGQQNHPMQLQRTVANPQTVTVKKKVNRPNNKTTTIWGAGASVGVSDGQFQNAFSTGSLSATQWSAVSVNHSSGAVTPGAAYWVRNTTGTGQGSFYGTVPPIASPTQTNGIALFDSDELDNAGGGISALGTGTAPANHKGELISPRIDLTGYTDSALALSFYTQWRNFGISEFSASLSVDDGVTWTSQSILTVNPPQSATSQVNLVFANATVGVINLSSCRIKFTFDGNYYYAMVDDVSISTANPFDLTIATADPTGNTLVDKYEMVQITDNASIPIDQLTGQSFRYGANVKNLGFEKVLAIMGATLELRIQRENAGIWTTVHQQTTIIDTINGLGNGTAVLDSLNNTTWATVGSYRAIYNTTFPAFYGPDANLNNDTIIQNFEINAGNYWSKVGVNGSGQPSVDRPLFPGGTAFNRFEFGSVFNTNAGLDLDSMSYQYFTTTSYTGTGSQVVRAYVYEWNDSAVGGIIDRVPDSDRNNAEFTMVGTGIDSLSGLSASGVYTNSLINLVDTGGNKLLLMPNSHYLVTLALEGSAFTSTNSIWLGTSTERNYALNAAYSSGVIKATSHIFLEDGAGIASGNWLGFGLDIVPSFGLHTTANPCISFNVSTVIDDSVSCNGGMNGVITATTTGGSDSLSYSWSNGDTTAIISGLVAGTYTVTVTDTSGCTAISSSTLKDPSPIPQPLVSSIVVASGADTSIIASSLSQYSILWFDKNDSLLYQNDTLSLPNQINTDTFYVSQVEIKDYKFGPTKSIGSSGNFSSVTAQQLIFDVNRPSRIDSVTVYPNAPGTITIEVKTSNGVIVDSATVTVTASGGNPEQVYLGFAIPVGTGYTMGASATSTGGLIRNSAGASYPYSDPNNSVSITGNTFGTSYYYFFYEWVVNTIGCESAKAEVIANVNLDASTTLDSNVSCNGFSNGGLTANGAGGSSPYTYVWSNSATNSSITGIGAGIYTVTVTDNAGNTATRSETITEPTILTTSTIVDSNITCNGATDGGASANVSGGTTPYTYAWSNAAITASITGVAAGTYTITTTDANGCTVTGSSTITEPTAISLTITSTNISCNGLLDGSTNTTVTGGTASYNYLWSNGVTTAIASGLAAGTYTVTLTDANGCTATSSTSVTEPTVLSSSISSSTNVTCNGNADGSATGSATGGTASYTYLWSNGVTTATTNGLAAGTYTVTLTDANSCTSISSTIITEPAAIIDTVSRNGFTLTSGQVGSTYQWLDCNNNNAPITGATMQTYTVTSNGNYAVEVTFNGCVDTSRCTMILNVGVNEQRVEDFKFKLYPNPNMGLFTIELNEAAIGETLQIINLSGSLISTIDVVAKQQLINLSDLSNGVYFVRYENNMMKFILSR